MVDRAHCLCPADHILAANSSKPGFEQELEGSLLFGTEMLCTKVIDFLFRLFDADFPLFSSSSSSSSTILCFSSSICLSRFLAAAAASSACPSARASTRRWSSATVAVPRGRPARRTRDRRRRRTRCSEGPPTTCDVYNCRFAPFHHHQQQQHQNSLSTSCKPSVVPLIPCFRFCLRLLLLDRLLGL